jgi:bifunctional UDP-N-acetylglucosamine pyrophosphorylase/glucosamine-1-phosphate N-acetyltransferase
VVLAAGQSKRFRTTGSKLAHPLGGHPIIHWPLAALRRIGVAPIVVVVAPDADDVRRLCGTDVVFAVQDEPRGTGHAVLAARPALRDFDGSLVLLAGDLPRLRGETLRRLIDAHRRSAGSGLSLLTAIVDHPHGWGRIVRTDGRVQAIVEERDCTDAQRALREVNVGVYCVRAPLLFTLLGQVKPNNMQHEIYLTDIVAGAIAAGVPVSDVAVDVAEVGQVNSRGELASMEKALRTEINTKWMAAGVTLEDPDTAYIGPEVTIGADTTIGPNVQLRGRTTIGAGCRLDGSAFITDSAIGNGVHLRFGVVMTEATIADRCEIGPFANLRPKSRLAEDVHIGDFVETKNVIIGRGTKANHITYLGDAEIGAGTNIGAGTVICNYDGFAKHRTVIGNRVQVGSDTTLVAPVTIGDDVYVATATTVRTDVAPGVLVFNPRTQEERPGWVAAFRARKTGVPATPAAARHKKRSRPKASAATKTRPPAARPTRRSR